MAVIFTDQAYQQYLRIARIVLGEVPSDLGIPFDSENSTQNVQLIRVTGAATTMGLRDYYPGRVRIFNASAAFADAIGSDQVWIIHPNAAELTTSGAAIYPALQIQSDYDVNGTIRPLFVSFQRPLVSDVECVGGNVTPTIVG